MGCRYLKFRAKYIAKNCHMARAKFNKKNQKKIKTPFYGLIILPSLASTDTRSF